jgi:hypothetical protein
MPFQWHRINSVFEHVRRLPQTSVSSVWKGTLGGFACNFASFSVDTNFKLCFCAAAAVSLTAAEEGKAEEQMLTKLEEKVLKLKETMSSVLAAQALDLEKLANVAEFVAKSGSRHAV